MKQIKKTFFIIVAMFFVALSCYANEPDSLKIDFSKEALKERRDLAVKANKIPLFDKNNDFKLITIKKLVKASHLRTSYYEYIGEYDENGITKQISFYCLSLKNVGLLHVGDEGQKMLIKFGTDSDGRMKAFDSRTYEGF